MQLQTTILVVLHKIIYDITCITNTELEMPPPPKPLCNMYVKQY